MTNPLFLRYRFLDSLQLGRREENIFRKVALLASYQCPLRIPQSPLSRHSLRCYHLSRHYRLPTHVSKVALFHNIYGTNFLDNSKILNFIKPDAANRKLVAFHIGCAVESAVYQYSTLTEDLLESSQLLAQSTDILALVFVNTIEIASSLISLDDPRRQKKLAFYVPLLVSICDLAKDRYGYAHASRLRFDTDILSSALNSFIY